MTRTRKPAPAKTAKTAPTTAPRMMLIPPQYAAHLEALIKRFRRMARAYADTARQLEALQGAIVRCEPVDVRGCERTLTATELLERLWLRGAQ
jgi:hypothetical protein